MADEKGLPVLQSDLDEDAPSCSPKIYVSNEEAALLVEMRRLREQSLELKKAMRGADPQKRSQLESEIDEMRARWKALSAQRERAFIRKMVMLGHLPPEADRDVSL
jgi:predicted  nucleic acid-binding Zn-ribbon protein